MKDRNIKERIDTELNMIKVNEKMKQNIEKSLVRRNQHKFLKTVAASFAILMLGGTTVAASYSFTNKISVNDEVLTELDEMHVMVSTYWILSWQITTIIFKGISQQMIKIMQ